MGEATFVQSAADDGGRTFQPPVQILLELVEPGAKVRKADVTLARIGGGHHLIAQPRDGGAQRGGHPDAFLQEILDELGRTKARDEVERNAGRIRPARGQHQFHDVAVHPLSRGGSRTSHGLRPQGEIDLFHLAHRAPSPAQRLAATAAGVKRLRAGERDPGSLQAHGIGAGIPMGVPGQPERQSRPTLRQVDLRHQLPASSPRSSSVAPQQVR